MEETRGSNRTRLVLRSCFSLPIKEISMLRKHIKALCDFYNAWEAMKPSIMVYMLDAEPDVQQRMKELYRRTDEVRTSGARDWLLKWSEKETPTDTRNLDVQGNQM